MTRFAISHFLISYLKRVAAGLDEDEAWKLFNQLLDALVHMSSLGIVRVCSGLLT